MKRIFSIISISILLAFSAEAQTKKWAVGFEVGEPVAVSIRKYGDKNGLDVSIGTYTGLLKGKREYRKGEYASVGFMFNATYLWYLPLMNQRMTAYGGVGAQINSRRYFPEPKNKDVHENTISTGPSVTLGLEFFSAQKPSSFFIEGGGYLEALPKIFYFNPNLSIGVRHNF
ncbi:hypothetical protein DYBT9275_01389 [Dyadobacter sp. CECT 9275]|uniref:Outer membrane protein beta-barrel domain-containing protein n=1 Tax=Dyadobacter helix TaxID=2822344 RepID=A0A916JDJ1_9BACT|nr:hypothetical protein [Dyadobacter sp. CECT 9275]CAG4994426.1 hypothetical protein DYBT9275_01389 [Dyadobacter sp. CECT 9275]